MLKFQKHELKAAVLQGHTVCQIITLSFSWLLCPVWDVLALWVISTMSSRVSDFLEQVFILRKSSWVVRVILVRNRRLCLILNKIK